MNSDLLSKYQKQSDILKALSHPSRLYILDLLEQRSHCVSDLTEKVGADTSTVSKHLSILKNAGLIRSQKQGKMVSYSLRCSCILHALNCIEETVLEKKQKEPDMNRKSILFLCTGNSCRSQMAEGWMRHLHGDKYIVHSAGLETHGLNPNAVRVMAEAGVDISGQKSELVSSKMGMKFDYIVTVCGHADENCPYFPGETIRIHKGFDDPPLLAQGIEGEEEKLEPYRRVRDEIKAYLETFPDF